VWRLCCVGCGRRSRNVSVARREVGAAARGCQPRRCRNGTAPSSQIRHPVRLGRRQHQARWSVLAEPGAPGWPRSARAGTGADRQGASGTEAAGSPARVEQTGGSGGVCATGNPWRVDIEGWPPTLKGACSRGAHVRSGGSARWRGPGRLLAGIVLGDRRRLLRTRLTRTSGPSAHTPGCGVRFASGARVWSGCPARRACRVPKRPLGLLTAGAGSPTRSSREWRTRRTVAADDRCRARRRVVRCAAQRPVHLPWR